MVRYNRPASQRAPRHAPRLTAGPGERLAREPGQSLTAAAISGVGRAIGVLAVNHGASMSEKTTPWARPFALEFIRGLRDGAIAYPLAVLLFYIAGAVQVWWTSGHLAPLPPLTASLFSSAAYPAFILVVLRGRPSYNMIPRLLAAPLATAIFALWRLYLDPGDWVIVLVAEIALALLALGLVYRWKQESQAQPSAIPSGPC